MPYAHLLDRIGLGKPARCAIGVTLSLLATSCAGGNEEEVTLACPRPAIIEERASLERVREGGSPERIEDLSYNAALQNIGGTCSTDGGDLVVNVTIETIVTPGPAFAGGEVVLPYFVAVVAPDGRVLDRQDFRATVAIAPGQSSGGTRESVSQRFVGLAGGAPGYRILFGLAEPAASAGLGLRGG
jgi:hypothetical protein